MTRTKSHRLLILAVAALAMPAAFAADALSISSLKGQARVRRGDSSTLVAVGSTIEPGARIQVASGSKLGVKLADGSIATFGPDSSFTITTVDGSNPIQTQIVLLSGSVSGNFTQGNVSVRTASGVVNATGSNVVVKVAPGTPGTPGKLTVVAVSGTPTVTPTAGGQPVTVPTGSELTAGAGAPTVKTLTLSELALASGTPIASEAPPIPGSQGKQGNPELPNFSVLPSDSTVLSPNGEGSNG